MKIALYGGTFNPIHIGHAVMADTVLTELNYDKVIFIPTFKAPHKESGVTVSPEDRLSMVKAFCLSRKDGRFVCESCEVDRKGTSYTYDTVKWIYENYDFEGKPGLIMGEEMAAEFGKWKHSDELGKMVELIVVKRKIIRNEGIQNLASTENKPKGDFLGDAHAVFNPDTFPFSFIQISNPEIAISSTEIRDRIRNGKSFKYLLPPSVSDFIIEKNLYRE